MWKTGWIPPLQHRRPGRRLAGAALPWLMPAEAVTPSFQLQLAFLSLPLALLSASSDGFCHADVMDLTVRGRKPACSWL